MGGQWSYLEKGKWQSELCFKSITFVPVWTVVCNEETRGNGGSTVRVKGVIKNSGEKNKCI